MKWISCPISGERMNGRREKDGFTSESVSHKSPPPYAIPPDPTHKKSNEKKDET
jgi:hypothetical protein